MIKLELIRPDQSNRIGIENIKRLIAFAGKATAYCIDALEDKKLSLWEAIKAVPLVREGVEVAINAKQLIAELKDLTKAEIAEIADAVGDELGINEASTQLFINEVLIPLFEIVERIEQIKNAAPAILK